MKKRLFFLCIMGLSLEFALHSSAMAVTILEKAPDDQSLKSGQIVYVENDGRCAEGMILKITGGNKSRNTKRQVDCVPRL